MAYLERDRETKELTLIYGKCLPGLIQRREAKAKSVVQENQIKLNPKCGRSAKRELGFFFFLYSSSYLIEPDVEIHSVLLNTEY